jgi:hypothetical protein
MKQLGCVVIVGVGMLMSACSAGPAPAQNPIEEAASRIHADCKDGDFEKKSACYDAQFGPIAESGDVRRALDVLARVAELDQDVARDGHLFVHAIGIAAFDPSRDFVATFKECTELFHAGCYHGLIQARLAAAGDIDAETVNHVCADVVAADTGHWLRFQCLHGVGHGVVIQRGHDLLKGLDACELLEDPWQRASCYGGAFMENVTNVTHPHHAALTRSLSNSEHEHAGDEHADHNASAASTFRPVNPDDAQYPCSIVKEHHKPACYGMQTAVILYLNGYDFGAAAKTCEEAPEHYRRTCHSSLGRDASGFASRDTKKLIDLCKLDRTINGQYCYVGAVKAVIDWTGKVEGGLPFCRAIEKGIAQLRCYQAVGAQISVIVPDHERGRALCVQAEGDNQNACLWGAGLIDEMPAILREAS